MLSNMSMKIIQLQISHNVDYDYDATEREIRKISENTHMAVAEGFKPHIVVDNAPLPELMIAGL